MRGGAAGAQSVELGLEHGQRALHAPLEFVDVIVSCHVPLPLLALEHSTASEYRRGLAREVRLSADDGGAALAAQNRFDRARLLDREHDDRHTVFAGKREGGGIQDLQIRSNASLSEIRS